MDYICGMSEFRPEGTDMGISGLQRVAATAETRAAYAQAGALLARRWLGADRAEDAALLCATFINRAKERMYSTATLRLYREQVLAYVATLGATPALVAAVRSLHVGFYGSRQGRTSGLKLQRISQMDVQALMAHLRREGASEISTQAADMFEASLMFGLRPVEWASAELEVLIPQWLSDVVDLSPADEPPTHRLLVRNAKHNLVRGNGETRLIYAKLTVEQASTVVRCIDNARCKGQQWRSWYKQLANALYYAAHTLWPRRKRVPCFYTARHQCIADAKSSGSEARVLAAIFGHASDWTARKHYSRKINGDKNRCLVRASRVSLLGVRNQSLTMLTAEHKALEGQAPKK